MITVTKPFSPPLSLYQEKVKEIFDNNWFTNHGPMVTEFEKELKKYFNVPYLVLVANGTIAIQIAIKALDIQGEVITTPFSYVATTSALVWENCTPRFVDIDPITFNIDVEKVQTQITKNTKAILATNVYGYPCDFEKLDAISKRHNIPVIYDNAHGFSTKFKSKDLLQYGSISTISFHSTKLFHSVEGGAIVCQDEATYKKLLLLRNFGHTSPHSFGGVGINGKMNELCAAMGLVNLKFLDEVLTKRKEQWLFYEKNLADTSAQIMKYTFKDVDFNYAYFPLLLESEDKIVSLIEHLLKNDIMVRRYFYPSLNTLDYLSVHDSCPISEDICKRVICLPMYHELSQKEQEYILSKIKEVC